jgi:sulfoxide reductase heme-binding subunit YedZ
MTTWLLMRSTGLMAVVLLTATVVLGIVATAPRRSGRALTQHLHADVALLSVLLVTAHVTTAVLDAHAGVHLVDVVVPFNASYRGPWLGLGTLAVDLLLAVLATTVLRLRLGVTAWRTVHVLAYALWPLSVLHGLAAGTDASAPVAVGLTASCVAAVLAALLWRAGQPSPQGGGAVRVAAVVVALALTGAAAAWAVQGPLQPGWSARAAQT